jgi:putative membrane protein
MSNRSPVKFLMFGLVLSWPVFSLSAADQSAEKKIDAKVSRADQKFVREAIEAGVMEVELARIAAQRATHEHVKAFARQIQEDHGKSNAELKTIADTKGIELRQSFQGKHKRTLHRFSKLAGVEFDLQYIRLMIEDHKQELQEFQREADNGKDPDIKTFASKQIPILRKHLEMAQAADRQLRESSRRTPNIGLPHPDNFKTAAYESSFPSVEERPHGLVAPLYNSNNHFGSAIRR